MHDTIKPRKTIRHMAFSLASIGMAVAIANCLAADFKPIAIVAKRVPAHSNDASTKLVSALKHAESAQAAFANSINDYQATFVKRELIGRTLSKHTMRIKVREKPFSVYLRYDDPHEGREAIYVHGKNGENMLAHGTGIETLFGTVELSPTGTLAMRGNRYPVTLIGMSNMLEKVIEQWQSEAKLQDIEVKHYKQAKLGEVACTVIQTSHPQKRPHLKFFRTRLYLEKTTNLPVRVEQYGFPAEKGEKPPLVEQYTYLNITTNIGLKDQDFDPHNPEYEY